MALSHEHVGSKIPAKINTDMLTRTELLITLCYEIPCSWEVSSEQTSIKVVSKGTPIKDTSVWEESKFS